MERVMIPNILSIAGSDPSGGAGIQADIKAISANGGYAMAAITALTVQNTQRVSAVQMIEPAFVAQQIAALRADIRIDAVKIGMLGTADMVVTVFAALAGLDVPVVLDRVMVAKGGDRLLRAEAVAALCDALGMAQVITPNLPEAAELLGRPEAGSEPEMEVQARLLLALGPKAVLLKGGHLPGGDCPDLLATADGMLWLPGPRQVTGRTHGTGWPAPSASISRPSTAGSISCMGFVPRRWSCCRITSSRRM
jgi:hydroxymethylpyrimidine/phosphomethylpyrimidine kinase